MDSKHPSRLSLDDLLTAKQERSSLDDLLTAKQERSSLDINTELSRRLSGLDTTELLEMLYGDKNTSLLCELSNRISEGKWARDRINALEIEVFSLKAMLNGHENSENSA